MLAGCCLVVVAVLVYAASSTGGPFANLDGSRAPSFISAIRGSIASRGGSRRRNSPRGAPPPRVVPDLAIIAVPPVPGEGARLTWIGHASWLVQLDGKSLLIDPIFGTLPTGRREVEAGLLAQQLPHIDAVLVSHNHYDHLDLKSLKQVGAPIIAGLGLKKWFADEGLVAKELAWWESTEVGPINITFVPAHHWSRRGLFDANKKLWGGFVIKGPSASVYHAGDSAYFDGFREIGARFPDLDAALLPIGAYAPDWFLRMHMNPEQAVQAFVDLGARNFFAMHWGTFRLTDEPLDEPPRRLTVEWNKRGLPEKAKHILAIGETVGVHRSDDGSSERITR